MTDLQASQKLVEVLATKVALCHLQGIDTPLLCKALERAHEDLAQAHAVKKLGAVGLTLFKEAA